MWQDEFNGDSNRPALSNWSMRTGYGHNGWGNNEWQNYTNSSDNVYIDTTKGELVIAARCPSGSCNSRDGTITSGRIVTQHKFTVKYGRVQARIKVPSGQGTWSAFWMLGDNFDTDGWPRSGEIDIMEMFYKDKHQGANTHTTHAAAHWCADRSDGSCSHTFTTAHSRKFPKPLTDGYHVYEVEWDSRQIRAGIDGEVYYTQNINAETMSEFRNDFFLLLNIAVGGNLGGDELTTDWPQTMHVDWVRAYQLKTQAKKGIYSERGGTATQGYHRIIPSNEWEGNTVTIKTDSSEVTALEGSNVLAADFTNVPEDWSGLAFEFERDDWSNHSTLVFGLNTSSMTGFDDLEVKIEDTRGGEFAESVQLADYMPEMSAGWATYTIPFSDFNGIDFSDVRYLGFNNPHDVNNMLLAGKLFLDDIHVQQVACSTAGSVAFAEASYPASSTSASLTVSDECNANRRAVVLVDNGTETIGVGAPLDAAGEATLEVKFGTTDDNTQTLGVSNGNVLTARYTDANGMKRMASSTITE